MIIKSVGLTSVYVTHDQQEAFAIADHVAVMNAGRIEQIASPLSIYRQPRTRFVAQFLGIGNFVPVLHHQHGEVRTPIGTFDVDGHPDMLLVHPRGVSLARPDAQNAHPGTIRACIFRGDSYHVSLELDAGVTLEFSIPAGDMPDAGCSTGARLAVTIDPATVVMLHA
jgi:ABC-type Fe3+/spermidine/putrescine transport system ATPase subunit